MQVRHLKIIIMQLCIIAFCRHVESFKHGKSTDDFDRRLIIFVDLLIR